MDLLAEMNWGLWLFACGIIALCCILMLVVLIQRGRGSGLAGAFGGAGGSSAFGAKTGDILTWITVVLAAFFIMVTSVANHAFDQSPQAMATPVATGVPAPTGSTTPTTGNLPEGAIPFTASSDGTITLPPPGGLPVVPVEVPPAGTEGDAATGETTTTPAPAGADQPAGDSAKPPAEKPGTGDATEPPKGEDQDNPTP